MADIDKKKYIAPSIVMREIEIECSITAASARIDPFNSQNQVIEIWTEDPDETKSFTW